MRDYYHIPKVNVQRSYSAVPELPMGKQVQVDFGETTVKTKQGGEKLCFISFISHSDINMQSGLTAYKYIRYDSNA